MGARSHTHRWLRSNARVRSISWRLGRLLYSASRGDNLGSDISANGEAALQGLVASHASQLGTAWTVLDIGANRGEWTISLREQAKGFGAESQLRTVSVEPVPDTVELLLTNLQAHTTSRWEARQVAFSSTPGSAPIYLVGPGAGTNSLYSRLEGETHCAQEVVMVPTTTLDAFLADHPSLTPVMIKIDVEGHDYDVLTGGKATLAAGTVWCFQFEYNHRWISAHHYLRDVFRMAEEHGYLVGRVLPEGLERILRWSPELERYFECNFVLVRKDFAHWFIRELQWDDHNVLQVSDKRGHLPKRYAEKR